MSRYVFASAPVAAQTQLANGLNRIVIPVGGMTCATCEIAVRHALKRVDGVKSARVSVATKNRNGGTMKRRKRIPKNWLRSAAQPICGSGRTRQRNFEQTDSSAVGSLRFRRRPWSKRPFGH